MKTLIAFSSLFAALALAAPSSGQIGSVLKRQRIRQGFAGFVGPVAPYASFGQSLANLGDVDGNGVVDIAVGAPYEGLQGAIWVLRLQRDGSVVGEQKITESVGGFTGDLADAGHFGRELAAVGDLDHDGVPDLATVSERPNRLWVLFLNADGTVKSHAETVYSVDPAFVPTPDIRSFSGGLAALGDLDGDGLGDLAVGAPRDDDGAHEAGAIWILHMDADGTPRTARKISQTLGGLDDTLAEEAYFGQRLGTVDDLDGDGRSELAVTVPYDPPYQGSVFILGFDAAGGLSMQNRHGVHDYGLRWPQYYIYVGASFAGLGDLDGDGVGEIAVGFPDREYPGGTENSGAFAIAFTRPDGSVRKRLRISDGLAGIGFVPIWTNLGSALASLGDLDGDGTPELAVGANNELSGGQRTGGVWIVSLATDASRNPAGTNPETLVQAAEPVFGAPWALKLDCSAHASGLAIVGGFSHANAGVFTPYGEVLTSGTRYFQLRAAHASTATLFQPIVPPFSLSLVDIPIHVQGLCTGAPRPRLSNALDVVLGN